jgi:hypothetical protein
MRAQDGKVDELRDMEAAAREDAKDAKKKKDAKAEKSAVRFESDAEKWFARDWLVRWLKIEPTLGDIDLRPYVFVARDKRILAAATESSSLDSLIETLSGSEMAARSVEPQVKGLTAADAELVFDALRDRVLRHGSFTAQPPGFDGLTLVAKHHPRYQSDLLAVLNGIEPKELGIWVTRGWNEILTAPGTQEQLRTLLTQWASQDENQVLKRAAGQALATAQKGTR